MESTFIPARVPMPQFPVIAAAPMVSFMEAQPENLPFIEANTKEVEMNHLKDDCIIPVFSKDNEVTISHQSFIDTVREAARSVFPNEQFSEIAIRLQKVGGSSFATMTVATNYCYKDGDGCPVIETTWHLVNAWEGKGCQDLSSLTKGDWVHVIGRLRCRRYTDAAGIDRTQMDFVANNLERYEKL